MGVEGASVVRMISKYFVWGGAHPALTKASPQEPVTLLEARLGRWTPESFLGPTRAICGKRGEAVVCTKDPLLPQEAREAARVRHAIDTHRAPLQTSPHESTQSVSNTNITRTVSQLKHNTTHFNTCLSQEVHSHKVLQRHTTIK